jgi:nitroimidazol reductase NimA-like FMN-containing flavoprotein (pyridoxamine 5'-phosphate oxidase superfamily)
MKGKLSRRMTADSRAMSREAQIAGLLRRASVGYLATAVADQPHIIPIYFWFDADPRRIYFHGAARGRTRDNVGHNARVSFCVAEEGDILPGKTACEFSTAYASVCLEGRARLVEAKQEKLRGLQGLVAKYAPRLEAADEGGGLDEDAVSATAVYAIEIDTWCMKTRAAQE